jgi:hypothetical protein
VTYLLQQINEGRCNSFRKKLNGIWLIRQASKDAGEHQEVDIIIVDSTNLLFFFPPYFSSLLSEYRNVYSPGPWTPWKGPGKVRDSNYLLADA